ncbi:hypothetical protein E3Q23_01690 [Wallemia mellicola]|uniref:Uncharacterized protein n=1 Tax=Wallemia mellicola TaxID=1708541 RepID=A0A4T0R387_9BASI|nr:hypothetical protein E3Q23_01690 [Wallemia mellicola]TIC04389.1 hypothetical protein E3Q17_00451 [Wallemia mellicola]TIC13734.1 hypothetical protein E3Q14_01237 [Wallemia mellicola]TIC32019.1 hypothetical protein E3Q10_01278 [Wallemia mellicola]TIC41244.1 hypothetical protein E3Q08_03395 [Wallemia mellicola]
MSKVKKEIESSIRQTRNNTHFLREKKKCGAPRTFLKDILKLANTENSGVAFCCKNACGFKILNEMLKVSLGIIKEAEWGRPLTPRETGKLVPTFQKSCQNYFISIDECVAGACSKRKSAMKDGFEFVNTLYKFPTPFKVDDVASYLAIPNKNVAEKKAPKNAKAVVPSDVTTPKSEKSSECSERMEALSVTTNMSNRRPNKGKKRAEEPSVEGTSCHPQKSPTSLPISVGTSVCDSEDMSPVETINRDIADVPLHVVGISGYGYIPHAIPPSICTTNEVRLIDVFPRICTLPPPVDTRLIYLKNVS